MELAFLMEALEADSAGGNRTKTHRGDSRDSDLRTVLFRKPYSFKRFRNVDVKKKRLPVLCLFNCGMLTLFCMQSKSDWGLDACVSEDIGESFQDVGAVKGCITYHVTARELS